MSCVCAVEVPHHHKPFEKRIQSREEHGTHPDRVSLAAVSWLVTLDATAAMRIRVHGKAGFGYLFLIFYFHQVRASQSGPASQCPSSAALGHHG